MKFLILLTCLLSVSISYAEEVATECEATIESREIIVKGSGAESDISKGSSVQ